MAAKPELRDHRRGYFFAALTVITCPCHLPILMVLLSGSAVGAFLTEHVGPAVAIFAVVFVLSLGAALRTFQRQ